MHGYKGKYMMRPMVITSLGAALIFAKSPNAVTTGADNPPVTVDRQEVPVTVENFIRAATDWDVDNLAKAPNALNDVAALGFNTRHAFGRKEEVRPVNHLMGAIAGWGGLPRTAAMYILDSVEQNGGKTPYTMPVKDAPVDAFWSVSVYNKNGLFESNVQNAYSVNNLIELETTMAPSRSTSAVARKA
jgi:hypothetical protein